MTVGEWALDFGGVYHSLQGLTFNDLPPVLQNRLEDAEFTFVLIPDKVELFSAFKEIINA